MSDLSQLSTEDLMKMLQQHPAAQPDTGSDVLKSGLTGLAQGTAGLADLPDMIIPLAAIGRDIGNSALAAQGHKERIPSTSETLLNLLQKITGPLHEPQTVAGQYARTIASFAPAAVGGPEGVLPKIASVVVPGVASETAGQLSKGSQYEPLFRMLGGLAGGAASGIRPGGGAPDSVPSTTDLEKQASDLYKKSEAVGLTVKNDALTNTVSSLQDTLANNAAHPELHPNAMAAFNSLKRTAETGNPVTLKGLDIQRRIANSAIGKATREGNADDARLAYEVKVSIDDLVNGLKPEDVSTEAGNAQDAIDALNQARPIWSKAAKADEIQRRIDRADVRAGQYSQSGPENALRVEFRQLAMNDKAMSRFSPDEQASIKAVAQGGPVSNVLRLVGKFSPKGPVALLSGAAVGHTAGGIPGAVALPVAGWTADKIATLMTKARANNALQTMQRGGPKPNQPLLSYQNPYPLTSLLGFTNGAMP